MQRKMNIDIFRNGDVRYGLWRSKPYKKYLIEHPNNQITIENETAVNIGGYQKEITKNNLQLTWTTPTVDELSYVKHKKYAECSFNDEFKTKQDGPDNDQGYWFWLHWEPGLRIERQSSSVIWNHLDILRCGDGHRQDVLLINSYGTQGFELSFGKAGLLKMSLRFSEE